jgi:glutamate/tyrosine decarboxylase-like PLP-dependent enzyme
VKEYILDFRLPYISSINTSGHKWFGVPLITSVLMIRNNLFAKPERGYDSYAHSWELGPFGCSRSALAPLFYWYALASTSFQK